MAQTADHPRAKWFWQHSPVDECYCLDCNSARTRIQGNQDWQFEMIIRGEGYKLRTGYYRASVEDLTDAWRAKVLPGGTFTFEWLEARIGWHLKRKPTMQMVVAAQRRVPEWVVLLEMEGQWRILFDTDKAPDVPSQRVIARWVERQRKKRSWYRWGVGPIPEMIRFLRGPDRAFHQHWMPSGPRPVRTVHDEVEASPINEANYAQEELRILAQLHREEDLHQQFFNQSLGVPYSEADAEATRRAQQALACPRCGGTASCRCEHLDRQAELREMGRLQSFSPQGVRIMDSTYQLVRDGDRMSQESVERWAERMREVMSDTRITRGSFELGARTHTGRFQYTRPNRSVFPRSEEREEEI